MVDEFKESKCNAMYKWAGPKPLFIPLIFTRGRERQRQRESEGEDADTSTCSSGVLVSTWERVNNTPLRSAGGTPVSASALPRGRWLSDAYETRQRRSNLVVRHRSLWYRVDSLSTSPYLSMHTLRHRANGWRTRLEIRWRTSLVCKSQLESVFVCRRVDAALNKGLGQQQQGRTRVI